MVNRTSRASTIYRLGTHEAGATGGLTRVLSMTTGTDYVEGIGTVSRYAST